MKQQAFGQYTDPQDNPRLRVFSYQYFSDYEGENRANFAVPAGLDPESFAAGKFSEMEELNPDLMPSDLRPEPDLIAFKIYRDLRQGGADVWTEFYRTRDEAAAHWDEHCAKPDSFVASVEIIEARAAK